MNISMQLAAVVAVAACLCLVEGAPDTRLGRSKQQRPTRGFKNVEMMTARGFGKRDRPSPRSERDVESHHSSSRTNRGTPTFKSPSVGIARDFGKRTSEIEPEESIPIAYKPKAKLRVALGFGKRSGDFDDVADEEAGNVDNHNKFITRAFYVVAPDSERRHGNSGENLEEVYGADNFWEMLDSSPDRDGQEVNDEKPMESIPVDWFVNEMLNNPEFARAAVRKFIDSNQDGILTSEELLRNMV